MKAFLSGNQAVARGAYEGGCHVATAYPGTPSTEILENIAQYKEIHSEWCTNEKVALEVASGASFGGARALTAIRFILSEERRSCVTFLFFDSCSFGLWFPCSWQHKG